MRLPISTQRFLMLAMLMLSLLPAAMARQETQQAAQILKTAAVKGGLIVHIGCGDGSLTSALRTAGNCIVHGLDADPAAIDKARIDISSRGLYGPVSVDHFDGENLPYIDNLVNLVVAEDLGNVSIDEVTRVLAPLGVACLKKQGKWTTIRKPWPGDIDEWPQYLHGPDNNAVANDTVVGPPRHLQWVAGPSWSRSHMTIPTVASMVSSRGRLFTIVDTASVENPFLPGRFSLIAQSAFNGVILWKHDLADWEPVTRYVKDIAVQLQRRLAAIGDTLYCTPGLNAPVTAFDAATGTIIRQYANTQRTQEFACDRGVLYVVIGDRMNSARYNIVKTYSGKGISLGGSDPNAPFDGTGFHGVYAPESPDIADPTCAIAAVEADSGRTLWKKEGIRNYVACTLAVRGSYTVYQTADGLMCLDRKTGDKIWGVEKKITGGDGTEANTLILSDDTVYAKEGQSLYAYSLVDGSQKWKVPVANNYEKSADVFLAAGAVWTGGSKKPTSYDPQTGRQNTVITQRMTGPMGHDRCYRNFITSRYFINSKTGGADFLTLDTGQEFPNYWLRGTCGMGVLPCNGLLYAPPYSCQCSIGAMVKDFNAFYTETRLKSSGQPIHVERKVRLIKGPAYARAGGGKFRAAGPDDWPTYRHDAARSGTTGSIVPPELKPRWKARLTTVPSPLVIADNKVLVSDIHAHTICALDASNGRILWRYVADSRVDSPPTYHNGLVLFGSRGGWVYCLRASDGVLAWRFRDLPDKTICAFGQLESAWPICGSVLIKDDIAYFAAGRSSFLDGGIVVYGLDPRTGRVIHSRRMYGPFNKDTGFPATGTNGFKSDIFVADEQQLYLRHQAFKPDLTTSDSPGPHVIASAGFLDGSPQHRTFWTVGTSYSVSRPGIASGDILVTNGKDFYEVRGFPVKRHSYFDPRLSGYKLFAGTVKTASSPAKRGKGKRAGLGENMPVGKWDSNIPLTGKAMVLAGDTVFVAGAPMRFPPDEPVAKYEASYAGKLGGVLWAAAATDGRKLAEYELDSPPVFDGIAAAAGRIYVAMQDGTVRCWAK